MSKHDKQEGVLRVVGSSRLHIPLREQPKDIIVKFLDEEIVPCNHHHRHHHKHHEPDKLFWKLVYKVVRRGWFHVEKDFYLEVGWDVDTIRTIKWVANY